MGVILGMLWFFRSYWAQENIITFFLARRAYGVYIIHPPVLVVMSLQLEDWGAVPLAKFALLSLLGCIGSVLAASALLAVPGAKRIL